MDKQAMAKTKLQQVCCKFESLIPDPDVLKLFQQMSDYDPSAALRYLKTTYNDELLTNRRAHFSKRRNRSEELPPKKSGNLF
jgi:hypothetical protein